MRQNVFVCPVCPEPRTQMHLCDLREHIAEVHLDHFHTYSCPKCKIKFATAFKAHKHIREVCRIEGVVPMQEYTQAMLSYDAAYLSKMYELELAAIFKYGQACDRRTKPKTANVRTNTEKSTVDAQTQVRRTKTTETECQTVEERREAVPFASPTDEEPQEPRQKRSAETRRRSDPKRRTTSDQSAECSSSDSASARDEGSNVQSFAKVKREPVAEEKEREAKMPKAFKKEPPAEELPPPASPESSNSSVNVGPPSECDEHVSDAVDNEDGDQYEVKEEEVADRQSFKSSSDMDVDAPRTSNALPNFGDEEDDDDIQIIDPEEWEETSSRPKSRTSPRMKKSLYQQMKDRGYEPEPPSRLPSLLDWEIPAHKVTHPERVLKCMKVVVHDSTYNRVVNDIHVCEYENCCDPNIVSSCIFCHGRHISSECSSYPTRTYRKQEANIRPLCVRCGREYHGDCDGVQCRFCGKFGHHPAFCFDPVSMINMERLAQKNFPRWLPKIPELAELNRKRRLQRNNAANPERPGIRPASPVKKRRRMRENVFVCPLCPEPKKQLHLCDLREHIAEVHLDHFHAYFCPKCKEKFATAIKAHKHIREVCKVDGVVPKNDYTQALLSYDASYLSKMYELELAAIFKYVHACDRAKSKPMTYNVGTNTERNLVDFEVQVYVKTESIDVDCQTDLEIKETLPLASPTDEEPQPSIEQVPEANVGSSDSTTKRTNDQGTECSPADTSASGNENTNFVGTINVKKEPIEEEPAQETVHCLSKAIKQEPHVEEQPPPASPENSSANYGPPSEFDEYMSNEVDSTGNDDPELKDEANADNVTIPSSTDMDVDGLVPSSSHALPDMGDDKPLNEPEDWERASNKSKENRTPRKRKSDDQQTYGPEEWEQTSSKAQGNRTPRKRKSGSRQSTEHRAETYLPSKPSSLKDWDIISPNLTAPERFFQCMKIVQENSTYKRVINEEHVCEYEDCCQPRIASNCMFCFGNHYSCDCSSFPTLDTRKEEGMRLAVCRRCGDKYHGYCKGIKCTLCGKFGHHSAFCFNLESHKNLRDNAEKNFPRWLPKIAELEELNRRRELTKIKSPANERPNRRTDAPAKKRRRAF